MTTGSYGQPRPPSRSRGSSVGRVCCGVRAAMVVAGLYPTTQPLRKPWVLPRRQMAATCIFRGQSQPAIARMDIKKVGYAAA